MDDLTPSPRFTGIFIPVEILEDSDLSMLEQLLLSWIDALYKEEYGGCFAKNEYFAQRFGVKVNTIVKALINLRKKGLIEDVSFDGRRRVIRAKVAEYIERRRSQAACDYNHRQHVKKITGSMGKKSHPHYIESKEEIKEEITSLKVPKSPPKKSSKKSAAAQPPAATAACGEDFSPDEEFSEEVKETTDRLIKALQASNPEWRRPSNLTAMRTQVRLMLQRDKRSASTIREVFLWAIHDSFWADKLSKPNPAKYLRDHFAQLAAKMNAKPPVNLYKVDKRARDKDGNVIDAYKDDLF